MTLKQALLYYRLISRNQRLHSRRHPMFEKNRLMKMLGYLFVTFWAVYLIMLAFFVYQLYDGGALEAFDMVDGYMAYLLAFDFLMRFTLQETPAQDIHSYKLLPIPTRFLLNVFLLRMGLSAYNFFWFFFLLPFGLLGVVRFYGPVGLLGFLLGWWLLFVINSMWYLLWRTFVNRNVYNIAIPLLLHALLLYFGMLRDAEHPWLFAAGVWLGRLFVECSPLTYPLAACAILPLFCLNRCLQYSAVYAEIARAEHVSRHRTLNFRPLEHLGATGEYLKIEIRSIVRNAVIRKQFLTGFYCMLLLCLLFAFTDVYDGVPLMRIYICVYCFSCLSIMTLTVILCAEGNYMDGLMARKESILSLLRAKYYFNCFLMLVPLLLALFPISSGKFTLTEALGCLFFTSGVVMPFLFQLAVYNDSAINLNSRLTKSGRSTKVQLFFSSAALLLPMLLMYSMTALLGEEKAAIFMMAVGIAGTLSHPLWLRNIYRRFMLRRHKIMDGFRNSR